jgi:hypothetical protein
LVSRYSNHPKRKIWKLISKFTLRKSRFRNYGRINKNNNFQHKK